MNFGSAQSFWEALEKYYMDQNEAKHFSSSHKTQIPQT